MPFKSKSQRRFMHAAEARGDVPKGTAKKWEEHTPKGKELPEKIASAKSHLIAGGVGAALGATGVGYLGIRHGEKQRRLGQIQAANYLLAGPQGKAIRNTLLTNEDIARAQAQGQYEESYMTNKTAFEQGFEKEAFWGAIVGAAAKAGRGLAQGGRTLTMKSMDVATNPALTGLRRGFGRVGMGFGRGLQRAGMWMGRHPQATAGIATGTAGLGAVGLGASMMSSNKQASAFEQGFMKKATIGETIGKVVHTIGEHPDVLHTAELAGLGVLAVPGVANLVRNKYEPGTHEKFKDVAETAGLGMLAVPSVGHFASKFLRH